TDREQLLHEDIGSAHRASLPAVYLKDETSLRCEEVFQQPVKAASAAVKARAEVRRHATTASIGEHDAEPQAKPRSPVAPRSTTQAPRITPTGGNGGAKVVIGAGVVMVLAMGAYLVHKTTVGSNSEPKATATPTVSPKGDKDNHFRPMHPEDYLAPLPTPTGRIEQPKPAEVSSQPPTPSVSPSLTPKAPTAPTVSPKPAEVPRETPKRTVTTPSKPVAPVVNNGAVKPPKADPKPPMVAPVTQAPPTTTETPRTTPVVTKEDQRSVITTEETRRGTTRVKVDLGALFRGKPKPSSEEAAAEEPKKPGKVRGWLKDKFGKKDADQAKEDEGGE
ncbi:hypothetical protein IFO71_16260, partial [Pseudoxanthomonas sp. CAU 1598]|nr:hypothetical protein [Pseudomarimonas arenosa]